MPNYSFLSDVGSIVNARRKRMDELRALQMEALGSGGMTPGRTPPTFNPDEPSPMPAALPTLPAPRTMPLPTAGSPESLPMPPARRPGRGEQLQEARDVYQMGTPGRGKSIALGALRGALGGLASGQGLGGVIGGAGA